MLASSLYSPVSFADNPVVQTLYTADPAPLVYNDTVYLYTGHDEDNSTYYTMNDWRVYSSKDMANWTDHGSPLSYKAFSWSSGEAWASQVIERNGKFYFYVTAKKALRSVGPPLASPSRTARPARSWTPSANRLSPAAGAILIRQYM
ncbi:family 43 glycosylhydrolase [Paenibacillus rhizoplanae]